MEIQPPLPVKNGQTVPTLLTNRRRSERALFLVLLLGVLCLVPLLVIAGVAFGFSLVAVLLGLVVLIALIVRWPIVGFFVALGCTLLIEQTPLAILGNGPLIYVFYWPASLQNGLPDRPIGFLMLFVLLVFMVQGLLTLRKPLAGGALLVPYLLFLLCVAWGVVHGLSSGGDLKITIDEVRSFWYLFLGYLLAYNLVNSKQHVRTVFWFIILCAGIKALEGFYIYIYILHGFLDSTNEIMSHEESYFWIAVLLLIMLFSLHSMYRPQFFTALALVPFLLIALVANNRRVDFGALAVGMLVAWLLIFCVKPKLRRALIIILLISLVVCGAYVAAFYNGGGGFSAPARAVISLFHPDPRDAASNLYRSIEDYDLVYTVSKNPLGLGFGKPFLEPILLPNILSLDPVYLYIPHNTIYWVWMRLGSVGYVALWYLFGSMIVRGCVYARQLKDKYLQLVAIFVVAMIIMEIIVAFYDYQLSFYRNVIYVGMLSGILMKLPALDSDTKEEKQTYETTRAHTELSHANVGSRDA